MYETLDFSGPHLKTERAEHHIFELKRIFKGYIAANKKALTPKYNRKPRGRPIGANFPKHTPTILGDALHNLRAALDHAYCELVRARGHTPHERSFFPIVNPNGKDTWQSRKASMEGHEKSGFGPGTRIIEVLSDEVQPYLGGNGEDLVRLHELDIADKHMVLLPTQQMTFITDLRTKGGEQISGVRVVTSGKPAIEFGPGAGLDPSYNNKASFEICFGGGQPFEGQPIMPILEGLAARVDETLHLLEQRAMETR